MVFLCLLCVGLVGVTLGYPFKNGYHVSPQRSVMFSGYYSNPLFRRSYDISPQGSMSAVVTRDTVATNSFAGPQPSYPSIGELPIEENETVERYTEKADAFPPLLSQEPTQPAVELGPEAPQEDVHLAIEPAPLPVAEEEAVRAEEVSTEAAVILKGPKRAPKKKAPKPDEEDDDENLSALWPFAAGRGSVPSYNAFFPITITGEAPARSRKGNEDDYYPGSGTAIANSFSTGRGGIATSHAISFGDPNLASLIRKGLLNFRSKNPQDD